MMRALTIALALLCSPAPAQPITGPARVIDGDTIELAGQRIRLAYIDAPELGQMCEQPNWFVRIVPGMPDTKPYECGRDAAAVLSELTRGRIVFCEPTDRDRYGRIVAVCKTPIGENATLDLGAEMVKRGWAVDFKKYSGGRYAVEEAQAKAGWLGLHSGRFTLPEEWRKRK